MEGVNEQVGLTFSRRGVLASIAGVAVAAQLPRTDAQGVARSPRLACGADSGDCDLPFLTAAAVSGDRGWAVVTQGGNAYLRSFQAPTRSSGAAQLSDIVASVPGDRLPIGVVAGEEVHVYGGKAVAYATSSYTDDLSAVTPDQQIHLDPTWEYSGYHEVATWGYQPWVMSIDDRSVSEQTWEFNERAPASLIVALSVDANVEMRSIVAHADADGKLSDFDLLRGHEVQGTLPWSPAEYEYDVVIGSNGAGMAVLATTGLVEQVSSEARPPYVVGADMRSGEIATNSTAPPAAIRGIALGSGSRQLDVGYIATGEEAIALVGAEFPTSVRLVDGDRLVFKAA